MGGSVWRRTACVQYAHYDPRTLSLCLANGALLSTANS